jgi:nitrile hydratase accessory protein
VSTELPVELDVEGMAAPPRANGELVFSAPWESRIFGVTVSLHQAGLFEWRTFQQELIRSIGRWEAGHAEGEPYSYWSCWLDASERMLADLDAVAQAAIDDRAAAIEAQGSGHDDDHDHDHDHRHG